MSGVDGGIDDGVDGPPKPPELDWKVAEGCKPTLILGTPSSRFVEVPEAVESRRPLPPLCEALSPSCSLLVRLVLVTKVRYRFLTGNSNLLSLLVSEQKISAMKCSVTTGICARISGRLVTQLMSPIT